MKEVYCWFTVAGLGFFTGLTEKAGQPYKDQPN